MKVLRPAFNILCVAVLFGSHLSLSYDYYGGWWYSAAGLLSILTLGVLAWKSEFFVMSGVKIALRELPVVILTAGIMTGISFLILRSIGEPGGIRMLLNSPKSYVHNVFYIINEEIILGALVLYFLTSIFRLRPLTSSFLLALLIAFAHWVLYKWYFRNPGSLETGTLFTLFFVAFLKNNLILKFRHIGYAWALHFGWMSVMFGTLHFSADGRLMTDLEKFNLYLGSAPVLIASAALAIASLSVFANEQRPAFSALKLLRKPKG
jgi:hypothetical protein